MAIGKTTLFVLVLVLVIITETDLVKIHRASPRNLKSKPSQSLDSGWFSLCRFLPDFSNFVVNFNKEAWVFTIPATIAVGLCGVLPVLLIPVESGHALREGVTSDHLRLLLSFAVGGLLGDVFLHLLPEAWSTGDKGDPHTVNFSVGAWIIIGLFSFFILEKAFGEDDETTEEEPKKKEAIKTKETSPVSNKVPPVTANGVLKNSENPQNGFCHKDSKGMTHTDGNASLRKRQTKSGDGEENEQDICDEPSSKENVKIKVIGYLNLFANFTDNFTHGLAIAGSFLVGRKVGLCTTCAILLHEIPHEIGDFAILLKSGFNKKDAAVAQITTATGGLFGAVVGLLSEHAGDSTSWILPLSSGGFLYIALVTIIPELLQEKRPLESAKQTVFMLLGIASMAMVTLIG